MTLDEALKEIGKVTEKAFGRDRRYPLTSGFRNWN